MRQCLFLHYGWFLQNLEKGCIRTNMHTIVSRIKFQNRVAARSALLETMQLKALLYLQFFSCFFYQNQIHYTFFFVQKINCKIGTMLHVITKCYVTFLILMLLRSFLAIQKWQTNLIAAISCDLTEFDVLDKIFCNFLNFGGTEKRRRNLEMADKFNINEIMGFDGI